jgi:ATP-dependent Clp protease ATP-binding subunit ClpC
MNTFSPRAQQVLALARKQADRLNHNYVGTEHMLAAIIALGQGTAFTVLQKLGIDPEELLLEVEKQVGAFEERTSGNIPYTPRVKKVLALAGKEAKALHHNYVGTEHILIGLVREGDGVAARILLQHGCDVERVRQKVIEECPPETYRPPPASQFLRPPASADQPSKFEEEFARTREEISKKFEMMFGLLDAVKADIAQLRHDVLKGNS